ncbi:MAG TPA: shikimate dehydrogenase [Acidimicrobiales bacterium]|nr:shikimate dehydrogenase [Acidimicrobiales bacterium]
MRGRRLGAPWPVAATRVAAVIGHPVTHSLSPVLHNAAFAACGLDWAYLAFDVAPGAAGAALEGMRALGIDGLSVTTPHKDDVARLVDRLSPTAERLKAVNTVVRLGDELVGESTDGQGLVDAVRVDHGFDPAGRRCVVRGSGGAARAVVLALAEAGAEVVVVPGRSAANAEAAVALAGAAGRLGAPEEAAGADLVVNATTLGRPAGPADLPFDPERLGPGQLVVDIVYPVTPFVLAARERGAAAVDGLGMLLHQAAGAFRLWTGHAAPLEAMSAAVVGALTQGD